MAFQQYLQSPSPNISKAISEFTETINEAARSPGQDADLERALWKGWRNLIDVTAITAHDSQGHLVEFVKELRKARSPKKDDGSWFEIWGASFEWVKLPLFGAGVREEWNEVPESHSPKKDQDSWINRNAFLAQLTAVSEPDSAIDFSLYGIWAMRPALEDVELSSESAPLPDNVLLKTAAVWILYAGKELKKRGETGQVFDGKVAREGDALVQKGWRGFNAERWNFWTTTLQSLAGKVTDKETKELLEKALDSF